MPLIAPKPDFESLFGTPNNPLIEPTRVTQINSEIVTRFFKRYLLEDPGISLSHLDQEFSEILDFGAHEVDAASDSSEVPQR